MSARDKANRVLIHVILILVSITMLVPFLWMILTAFKTMTEATSVNPFVILPSTWRWDSFKEVIENMDFLHLYINTLLLILGRVVCAVLTATLAGYAFGRQGEKPDVLSGTFPDDGSWTDLHYPTVLNGK
jgi:multiple sugar transport system permease protein